MKLSVSLRDFFLLPRSFKSWREYFIRYLGQRRFFSILESLGISQKSSHKILEKELALILLSIKEPKRNDLQEALKQPEKFSLNKQLKESLSPFSAVEDLPQSLFKELFESLSEPLDQKIEIDLTRRFLEDRILDSLYFLYSSFHYDPFWYLKERQRLREYDYTLPKPFFYEKLAGFYATCEDLEVGSYIPAPSEKRDLYYRIAAKLFTGSGQISWLLLPATAAMDLDPIRFTRGSPGHPAGYDFASHIITDFEVDIGKLGYESGLAYEEQIQRLLKSPWIELGYSIGGSIAQYRAAEYPEKVKELWTFRSPGVPKKVWEKFQKGRSNCQIPLHIHIYRSKGDIVDLSGDVHLGWQADANTRVSVVEIGLPRILSHRYSFVDPKEMIIKSLPLDSVSLDNLSRSKLEERRKKLGPKTLSPFFRACRVAYRKLPYHRTHQVRGLWLETPKSGLWELTHTI